MLNTMKTNKIFLEKFAADGIEYKPVLGSFVSGAVTGGGLKYLYNQSKKLIPLNHRRYLSI